MDIIETISGTKEFQSMPLDYFWYFILFAVISILYFIFTSYGKKNRKKIDSANERLSGVKGGKARRDIDEVIDYIRHY